MALTAVVEGAASHVETGTRRTCTQVQPRSTPAMCLVQPCMQTSSCRDRRLAGAAVRALYVSPAARKAVRRPVHVHDVLSSHQGII